MLMHVAQMAERDNGMACGCQSGTELMLKSLGRMLDHTTREIHYFFFLHDSFDFALVTDGGGGGRLSKAAANVAEQFISPEERAHMTPNADLTVDTETSDPAIEGDRPVTDAQHDNVAFRDTLEPPTNQSHIGADDLKGGATASPILQLMMKQARLLHGKVLHGQGPVLASLVAAGVEVDNAVNALAGLSTNTAYLKRQGIILDSRYCGNCTRVKCIISKSIKLSKYICFIGKPMRSASANAEALPEDMDEDVLLGT